MKQIALALALTLALVSTACSAEPAKQPAPASDSTAAAKQPTADEYKAYLQMLDIRGKALLDAKSQTEALIRMNDVAISKAQEGLQALQPPEKSD